MYSDNLVSDRKPRNENDHNINHEVLLAGINSINLKFKIVPEQGFRSGTNLGVLTMPVVRCQLFPGHPRDKGPKLYVLLCLSAILHILQGYLDSHLQNERL